jgi:lysophospholipase L1-like esterase
MLTMPTTFTATDKIMQTPKPMTHHVLPCCASGLSLVWLLLSGAAQAQVPGITVPMDDPAILYSPFNWGVSAQAAKTINSGAYFKVLFSGTSCQLMTDTSGNAAPFSQFWARVDGTSFTRYTLAAGNPTFTIATNLLKRKHMLEVVVKSTSETIDRWTKQKTGITFTGLMLDAGAKATAPTRKPFNILIFGDSITEGVRVNGYAGIANDTDRNDALQVYSWLLSQEVPAEVGVVGFGATGIIVAGSGGVPALGKSYPLLWAGQPRSFTNPEPDLIIYNEGTNDGSSITSGMLAVVRALLLAAPNAKQLLLLPFNGSHAAELKSVVATLGNNKVVYGDTKGFFNTADSSDALHPYGYANIAFIAPKLASLVTPLLSLAPSSLTAAGGDQSVTLRWMPLVGATNYAVKRALVSGGPYVGIGTTTSTNFSDTTVTNGATYFYVVSAAIATGESANSGERNATPHATPELTVRLDAIQGEASVSWPVWATNYTLYAAPGLTLPTQWQAMTNGAMSGSNSLTVAVTNAQQQFYQLKAPF